MVETGISQLQAERILQSIRDRTASAVWRSENPSVNCSTVARAKRPGASAGRPRRGNRAANWLAWYKEANASTMRRHAHPFGNAACATRRVSSGTLKSTCNLSDMAESSTSARTLHPKNHLGYHSWFLIL